MQLDMQHPSRSTPTHIDSTRLDNPTSVASTASRFLVSMRKSFSPPTTPRGKTTENPRAAMYSTPEERHSRASRSHYIDSRPTIEQISMGLHVSRTPHLRPLPNSLQRHAIPSHPSRDAPIHQCVSPNTHHAVSQYHTRHSLPPPPPRSSMKKTSTSVSTLTHPPQQPLSTNVSPSTSVVTSATQGSVRPSLRARMSKFIPGYRPLSFPSSLGRASSFTSSASDSTRPATPRKAVRFSTSVLAIDEQS